MIVCTKSCSHTAPVQLYTTSIPYRWRSRLYTVAAWHYMRTHQCMPPAQVAVGEQPHKEPIKTSGLLHSDLHLCVCVCVYVCVRVCTCRHCPSTVARGTRAHHQWGAQGCVRATSRGCRHAATRLR